MPAASNGEKTTVSDDHTTTPAPGEPQPPAPHEAQPEYLQQGAGTPLPPESHAPAAGGGSGRKSLLIGGAVVGGLALAGAGAWAAVTLAGGGPQPTEALPADTLAFMSIDLDPSAGQKIEAMKMLNKFPAFDDEFGIDPTDDIRKVVFDKVLESDPCDGLTYDDDIAPWIGDRAAIAAVSGSDGKPAPVFVLQVTDDAKAEDGLGALVACGDSETGGFVVQDGWATVAEDEETAQAVADDAAEGDLESDADYQQWMDEIGDAGFVTMYAAPDSLQSIYDSVGASAEELSAMDVGGTLSDFKGMAGTVRFNDGALEMEIASATPEGGADAGTAAGELAASLPEDTAGAISFSIPDGWLEKFADQMAQTQGGDQTGAELLDQLSQETGLDLPEDFETLTGDAISLSVSADIDVDALSNSGDMSELPAGLRIKGDADAIQEVVDKLTAQLGPDAELFTVESDGDLVAISPSDDYRSALLEDGGLGDVEAFTGAVPEGEDSSMVVFVNFDAGDGWLDQLVEGDAEVADNVEPLDSLGMSAWADGDTAHVVLKLTTD